MHKIKVLFICKRGGVCNYYGHPSSGLRNSANFVVNMLRGNGIPAKFVEVVDNNGIDREVTAYRPTHVIIEALWVVPSKFDVLQRLHPDVHWTIRIHSEIPFLANEGMAAEWIIGYLKNGSIDVAPNSLRALKALKEMAPSAEERLRYLPNYYPAGQRLHKWPRAAQGVIDIGCFGAVRPLKNQAMQAIAAISFARSRGLHLRFHMNGTRVEQGGSPVLKNITTLFAHSQGAELVLHPWLNHKEFTRLVRQMDVVMQVSLTETFNIVSADSAVRGVPVVVSPEIAWAVQEYKADPTSLGSIEYALETAYDTRYGWLPEVNYRRLQRASRHAAGTWLRWLNGSAPLWVCWGL